MSRKELPERYFDIRSRDKYLSDGIISNKDVEQFVADLPDDQDNFELCVLEDEDLESDLSDEEIENMPPMKEEDIDNFDFLSSENSEEKK